MFWPWAGRRFWARSSVWSGRSGGPKPRSPQAEAAINHRPPDFERAEQSLPERHRGGPVQCPPLAEIGRACTGWSGRSMAPRFEDHANWKTIPILYQMAATASAQSRRWALAQRASQGDPPDAEPDRLAARAAGGASAIAARSSRRRGRPRCLYPTNAELHARLAEASAEISMYQDAVTRPRKHCGSTGLRRITDKKLPQAIRERLEALIPKWTENAAKMPIQARSLRSAHGMPSRLSPLPRRAGSDRLRRYDS